MSSSQQTRPSLGASLSRHGLRATKQREHVWSVLQGRRDHPTADEIYSRAKASMPTISLATVYNCLETLVDCELIKKLNYEREPSRFCPNDGDHAHFLDERSGRVFDIDLPADFDAAIKQVLPPGFKARRVKLTFTGDAPEGTSGPPHPHI